MHACEGNILHAIYTQFTCQLWHMVHTGFLTFYARRFPGLFQDFYINYIQGVHFSRHSLNCVPIIIAGCCFDYEDSTFPNSATSLFPHETKPNDVNVIGCVLPLLFLCLSLFMWDFNALSPMFQTSMIRSQHLHKAFFLSPLNAVSQPLYCELSSHCQL